MKIGLVGGYGHESVKLFPMADLAWACDAYDRAALRRAEAFGCERVFPSLDVMLDEFRPDVVYVGSIYAHNGDIAAHALERGFDVVSEKPLAARPAMLDRLRKLVAAGDRRLVAEFTMRWHAAFKKGREIILAGAIGEPVMIQAQKTYQFGKNRPDFYGKRDLFGGIIPWVASHAIDYVSWCTGLRYESVTAVHGKRCFSQFPEMEDHAAMLFGMGGNVPCVITADFLRPDGAASHGDDRMRVTGTEGVLEVQNSEVLLTTATGLARWTCQNTRSDAIQCARDLVGSALGESNAILPEECLHVAAVSLAARESADRRKRTEI